MGTASSLGAAHAMARNANPLAMMAAATNASGSGYFQAPRPSSQPIPMPPQLLKQQQQKPQQQRQEPQQLFTQPQRQRQEPQQLFTQPQQQRQEPQQLFTQPEQLTPMMANALQSSVTPMNTSNPNPTISATNNNPQSTSLPTTTTTTTTTAATATATTATATATAPPGGIDSTLAQQIMAGQLAQVGGYSDVNTLLAQLLQTPMPIQQLLARHIEVIQQQVRSRRSKGSALSDRAKENLAHLTATFFRHRCRVSCCSSLSSRSRSRPRLTCSSIRLRLLPSKSSRTIPVHSPTRPSTS